MKQTLLLTRSALSWLAAGLLSAPALAQTSSPATLYVNDASTAGDVYTAAPGSDLNGDGSAAAPFATVNHALAMAGATTQTVRIDAGTYAERIVLDRSISLYGAGAQATIFDGGLSASLTQTSEAGLRLTALGGTVASPLTIAGLTLRAYDFGVLVPLATNSRAYVLLEDVDAVDNRRTGIDWNCLGDVHDLTFRRVRATGTAAGLNPNANGAGRGLFLVNGHKHNILIEDGTFTGNRRSGIDVNDGSVSGLTIRGCRFAQNLEPALSVLGAAGQRSGGSFSSPAALIEGNVVADNVGNAFEFKSCTGSGLASGAGSFVVQDNLIVRPAAASASLSADKAALVFIDRDRGVIAGGGGVNGDLVTGGVYIRRNVIRGYQADAASVATGNGGFGIVLEGSNNKVFGNVVSQCQVAVQVQDRPTGSTGPTPFFDLSRNGYLLSSGDSIRGNRLDSCAVALRGINLSNPVEASLNWLGDNGTTAVRGTVLSLAGPGASFAALTNTQLDYSPFVHGSTDASAAAGFQPELSYLHVDAASPRSGSAGTLQEGLDLLPASGTLAAAAGTYAETSTVSRSLTLTSDGSLTLRDLSLSGSGAVLTLGAPLTLSGSLTLNSGLLRTTSANLLTLADGATASVGNAGSYVDGPLRKLGPQAFVFPLGKAGSWARLGISAPASASAAFTAEYFATPYASLTATGPLSEVSQLEHWTLSGTPDAVQVRLYWEDAYRSGIDNFSADLQVARYDGSAWVTAGTGGLSGSVSSGSVVSAQALSSFGAFTLGSLSPTVNPLGSQVATFQAVAAPQPGTVDLRWVMAGENNTYGYAVERSTATAGSSWQQIGFVASQGLTTQARVYSYQDQTARGFTQAAYRLRQSSPSGVTRYSDVATVTLGSAAPNAPAPLPSQFVLYPNPATTQMTLFLSQPLTGAAQVVVLDVNGRAVLTQRLKGDHKLEVSVPLALPAGVYVVQLQGPGVPPKPQRLVVR